MNTSMSTENTVYWITDTGAIIDDTDYEQYMSLPGNQSKHPDMYVIPNVLVDHIKKEMQKCINRTDKFYEDIIPQIGGLCIQDFENLNEMGIALSKLNTNKSE